MALRAVPEHPKFADFKTRLNLPKAVALGYLECIWHFTGRFTPQGNIGKYSDASIEAWCEWPGEPGVLIEALTESRWIDRDPDHRLLIHDWHEHADNATKMALKRAGKIPFVSTVSPQCLHTVTQNATVLILPVPVPVPVPEPEPPSESQRNKLRFDDQWLKFRSVYPKRAGTDRLPEARRRFDKLSGNSVGPDRIIDGARRYSEFCGSEGITGTGMVMQIATWLNQDCYDLPFEPGKPLPGKRKETLREESDRLDRELAEFKEGMN